MLSVPGDPTWLPLDILGTKTLPLLTVHNVVALGVTEKP